MKALGGGQHDFHPAVQLFKDPQSLLRRHASADAHVGDTGGIELAGLVIDKRQQGIDDDRHVPAQAGGDQEAKGLAGSGGKDDYLVPDGIAFLLLHDPVRHQDLVRFECFYPEPHAGRSRDSVQYVHAGQYNRKRVSIEENRTL